MRKPEILCLGSLKKIHRKYPIFSIWAIWSILSLFGGVRFIKYHGAEWLNGYGYKPEQIISAMVAFIFAAVLIYLFCSFVSKAVCHNGEERKICFYSFPFLVILAVSLLNELSGTHIGDYHVGDEKNIWDAAVRLYPFFFVYTSEIFLICFLFFLRLWRPVY